MFDIFFPFFVRVAASYALLDTAQSRASTMMWHGSKHHGHSLETPSLGNSLETPSLGHSLETPSLGHSLETPSAWQRTTSRISTRTKFVFRGVELSQCTHHSRASFLPTELAGSSDFVCIPKVYNHLNQRKRKKLFRRCNKVYWLTINIRGPR